MEKESKITLVKPNERWIYMKKFKRIFVVVMDSVGFGYLPDAEKFGDLGAHTISHTASKMPKGLHIPFMESCGVGELAKIKGVEVIKDHPHSYVMLLKEQSNGKDTMTGHWEMMGVLTSLPFQTFTDTGFPKALIDELAQKTGHKIIGNYSASGTEILKELGMEQMRDNSLIVYTSADSVLQIAAHEEVTGVKELYRCCDIAREICMRPEYMVGRIIARPYIGSGPEDFKRTPNRHDLALSPTGKTTLDVLKENGLEVSAVGKISDIFNGVGITKTVKTTSNDDGMLKTIDQIMNDHYKGICFVNLVEFDSEYGHRRDPLGYGKALEDFDRRLAELYAYSKDSDLIMVTADHGNDPTWSGTDHTREHVPLIVISKGLNKGWKLSPRSSFADIGATILENFGLKREEGMIGHVIKAIFED